jgi:uncharacterized membrane protein YtjA (UPF0391 family)
MLMWALIFLALALIAGLFGFSTVAFAFAGLAKVLFYIFIVLFIVSCLIFLINGQTSPRSRG